MNQKLMDEMVVRCEDQLNFNLFEKKRMKTLDPGPNRIWVQD